MMDVMITSFLFGELFDELPRDPDELRVFAAVTLPLPT